MTTDLAATFGVADYVVFVFMLVISAGIGVYSACTGEKQKTTQELLLGNRNMKVLPVAMSVLASFLSAITLLGVPAEVYQNGTMFVMTCFGFLLMVPATAYLYLPVFYNLGVTSAYEYLELRFNRAVRSVASALFSINMLIFMAIVLYAPSLALSQVTGINLWFAVLSTGLVCTFYTSIGGIKAVVWTDFFQVILMFGSMTAIVLKGVEDVGGMKKIWRTTVAGDRLELFNFDISPTTRHTVWNLAIGGYFMWVTTYGCNQAMIQRYMSLPSLKAAQKTVWINLPGFVFLTSLSCFAGLVMYTKYYNCDPLTSKQVGAPDQLLPLFVMQTMGEFPGVPGLFVSGVFSGALSISGCGILGYQQWLTIISPHQQKYIDTKTPWQQSVNYSTVSSGVNSLAAITLEDLIKVYIKRDLSDVWASRLTKILACLYGVISIVLVIAARQMGNILNAAISILGMMGGPMLSLFTMGMFFPWTNSTGALVGVFTGLAASLWTGIGAFIYKPYIETLPVSIEGCANMFSNISETSMNIVSQEIPLRNDDIFPLYKVSYQWLSVIGCVSSVIVGVVVSFLTGCTRSKKIDPNLFISPVRKLITRSSPLVRKFLLLPNVENEIKERKSEKGVDNCAFCRDIEMINSERRNNEVNIKVLS